MPAVLNRVSHKGIAGILKGKLSRLKPYLRWFIVGLTLFFLLATLRNHWQEVAQIRLDRRGGSWWGQVF